MTMVEDFNTVNAKTAAQPKFRRISSANKGNSHLLERRYNHVRRTMSARKDRKETQSAVASKLGLSDSTLQENKNTNNIHNNKQSTGDKKKKKHGQITLVEETSETKSPKSKSTVQAIGLGRHRSFTRIVKSKKERNRADESEEKSLTKSENTTLISTDESKLENSTNEFQVVDENNSTFESLMSIECIPNFIEKNVFPLIME